MINSKTFSLLLLISFTIQTCSVDSNKLSRLGMVMLRSLPQARLFWQDATRGRRMSLQYEEEMRRKQEEVRRREEQEEAWRHDIQQEEKKRSQRKKEEERKQENDRHTRIEQEIMD